METSFRLLLILRLKVQDVEGRSENKPIRSNILLQDSLKIYSETIADTCQLYCARNIPETSVRNIVAKQEAGVCV